MLLALLLYGCELQQARPVYICIYIQLQQALP